MSKFGEGFHSKFALFLIFFLTSIPNIFSQKKILILGSSTSSCLSATVFDSCYLGRLQKFYLARGISVTFDNRAVPGYTVYKGMPSDFIPPLGREHPDTSKNITSGLSGIPSADVVLVNFPSNGYDRFSASEVLNCMRIIRNYANRFGKPCYITTTQPRNADASFSTSQVRKRMAEIKDSVLKEFGTFAINFWDGIVDNRDTTIKAEFNHGDGIHLNNAGHKLLFERVREANVLASYYSPLSSISIPLYAFSNGNNIVLYWNNSSSKVISKYIVEKSRDGVHFTGKALIAIDSSSAKAFTWIDSTALKGNNFYRVKALLKNELVEISKVVSVTKNDLKSGFSVYPNPIIGNNITLRLLKQLKGDYSIILRDSHGSRIFEKRFISTGATSFVFSLGFSLPKGLYSVTVQSKNGVLGTVKLFH